MTPTVTDVDNQSAFDLVHGTSPGKHTKHIQRREFKCREWRAAGETAYRKVGSNDNPADFFTKALDRIPFEKWRAYWFGCKGVPAMLRKAYEFAQAVFHAKYQHASQC